MATALEWLQQRQGEDWLIGGDIDAITARAQQRWQELHQTGMQQARILLVQPDPMAFLADFSAACHANGAVFLGNPDWGQQEWLQVLELVQPDLIWGRIPPSVTAAGQPSATPYPNTGPRLAIGQQATGVTGPPWIMIPTGGSSGQIRFAIHTWTTLMAAVSGFRHFFFASNPTQPVNSLCLLPLYHVSGLMQFLRSLTSGGQLAILPFKTLATADAPSRTWPPFNPADFFLSLVPTQLQRLLQKSTFHPWLAQFQTILLGGAPAWKELLEQARALQLNLAPTYGMTETASQVATLKPTDFLQGNCASGQVLPHARITICNSEGEPVAAEQIGRITIEATSLALGYYPQLSEGSPPSLLPSAGQGDRLPWPTDDLGFLDSQGYLHVVGRSSRKIITGGENVFSEEVEAVIRATGLVQDVCVVGLPDPDWGEAVAAVYVPLHSEVSAQQLADRLKDQLSKFKHPKHWYAIACLPRNSQGKINLPQLQHLILQGFPT